MKNIFNKFLIICVLTISSLTLVACGEDDNEILTAKAEEFVLLVDEIGEVTLDSWNKISSANRAYNYLDETEVLFKKVIKAKDDLDTKNEKYDELVENELADENAAKEQAKVDNFVGAVNAIPALNNIAKTDRNSIDYAGLLYTAISESYRSKPEVVAAYTTYQAAKTRVEDLCAGDDLQAFVNKINEIGTVSLTSAVQIRLLTSMYNDLSDSVKKLSGYQAAYEAYIEKYNTYHKLKDDEDIRLFTGYIDQLSKVTLTSAQTINYATLVYADMSENALKDPNVISGKVILDAAVITYNEMYAADQTYKMEQVIKLVNTLPEDATQIDRNSYNTLYDISVNYAGLSDASKNTADIISAYNIYKKAQIEFDAKNFPQIDTEVLRIAAGTSSISLTNLRTASATILKNHFNIEESSWNNIYPLLEENKIELRIYIYINTGSTLVGVLTPDYSLTNSGMSIPNKNFTLMLQELAETNDQIQSGGLYSFSANFVDASGSEEFLLPSLMSLMTDETDKFVW